MEKSVGSTGLDNGKEKSGENGREKQERRRRRRGDGGYCEGDLLTIAR